jgi:hypothetical protein
MTSFVFVVAVYSYVLVDVDSNDGSGAWAVDAWTPDEERSCRYPLPMMLVSWWVYCCSCNYCRGNTSISIRSDVPLLGVPLY